MTTNTSTLILLRHGESEWNAKNLFTGWRDVDLTATGVEEARAAGVFVCLYPPTHPGGITLDLVVYVLRAWASAVGVCRRLRTAETPMRLMRVT